MAGTQSVSEAEQTQIKPWPIYQALLLGCMGWIIGLVVLFVMATTVRRCELTAEFAQIAPIVICIVTLGAGWLFLTLTHRTPLSSFLESISWRQNDRAFPLWSGIGICLGMLMQNPTRSGIAPHLHSFQASIYFISGTVTLEPLIEELYFRGILFESLSNRFDQLYAITIVSVAFLLMHGSNHRWGLIPITLSLGVARILTRSTANCFALHASYNFSILLWDLILSHGN